MGIARRGNARNSSGAIETDPADRKRRTNLHRPPDRPSGFFPVSLTGARGGKVQFRGTIGLTALTDDATLICLGSLVDGISGELKYALMAGAVTGGGLTVIAHTPNPAGVGILQDAKVFNDEGISPLGLFLGALMPTAIAILFFWFCTEL